MLPFICCGNGGPQAVLLHWLGGSSRTWTEVMDGLARCGIDCTAIDLPGFGRASSNASFDIDSTEEEIIATVRSLRKNRKEPWFLVGHSMGGKFASMVARAVLDGCPGLENLRGLILVSPSPPSPEPMDEKTRQQMLDALGKSSQEAKKDREHAQSFVQANIGKLALRREVLDRTIDDVLRMNKAALVGWLTIGSNNDVSPLVGRLELPCLVMAGTEEKALGPEAQRQHTLPHLPQATLVALKGCGHLAPLERPQELVHRIVAFVGKATPGFRLPSDPLSTESRELILSARTSKQTRAVLLNRVAEDDQQAPTTLTEEEIFIVRAIADHVLPGCSFDLALRIDRWLALPSHDGWRPASLPPDLEAWRLGLRSLDAGSIHEYGVPFIALDVRSQDRLLRKAREGDLGRSLTDLLAIAAPQMFTAVQMSEWINEVWSQLTELYMADPRTMHRIGFTGYADEGGFTQIRIDEREVFER